MGLFFYTSQKGVNHAYQTLQEMARTSEGSDEPLPSPKALDDLDRFNRSEYQAWDNKIDAKSGLTKDQHLSGWNNFMRDFSFFGTVYEILQMYDYADGNFDGKIDFQGKIKRFIFDTRNPPANLAETGLAGKGPATHYKEYFNGKKTASQTTCDFSEFSVAHNTLPFGTIIEIEYGEKKVRAIVTDRGPFEKIENDPETTDDDEWAPHSSHKLDLTPTLFRELENDLDKGEIRVTYHVVASPSSLLSP